MANGKNNQNDQEENKSSNAPEENEEAKKLDKFKKSQEASDKYASAVKANKTMASGGYDHLEGPDFDKQHEGVEKNYQKKDDKKPVTELAEVKDRLLRLAAEFDNYKKKVAKDTEMAKWVGKAELVRSLMPALDEFELALSAFSNSSNDKDHIKGIELVFANIKSILKNEGLKEIETKGKFDPHYHEVMMAIESKEPEGTILEIVRKGYMFGGVMLRPSAVVVSKGEQNGKS